MNCVWRAWKKFKNSFKKKRMPGFLTNAIKPIKRSGCRLKHRGGYDK
jgi:hypothetical protein